MWGCLFCFVFFVCFFGGLGCFFVFFGFPLVVEIFVLILGSMDFYNCLLSSCYIVGSFFNIIIHC